jgi:ABC-type antimicrobial peptide transport system permease subunit
VLLSPPAQSAIPLVANGGISDGEGSTLNVVEWLILGPVILLPIIMLTGSAFSFAVRRQVRSLAVMSSLGARKSTLRFVTVSNGIWLGLLGGISGVVLGTSVSWFYAPALTNGARLSYPGIHLPLGTLIVVIISGAVIGAIVSAIPARAAAKVDILSAIRGTRRDPKARKRAGVISLLMLVIGSAGLAVTVPAWAYLDNQITKHLMDLSQASKLQLLVIYGAIASSFIAILGLLIGASWVLIFARFVFKRFGTTANYATDDLVYNRKRFTSVIATVIATSFLASVVLSFFYTMAKPGADRYRPYMEANQIQIYTMYNEKHMETVAQLDKYLANRASELKQQLESAQSEAPTNSATLVNIHRTFGDLGYKYYPSGELILGAEGNVPYINLDYNYLCPYSSANPMSKKLLKANLNNDWRLVNEIQSMPIYADCQRIASNSPSSFIVATPEELRILLGGRVDENAEQALRSDNAVVFNKGFLTKGALQLNWYPSGIDPLVYGDKELPNIKYFPAKDASGKLIRYGKPSRTENVPAVLSSSANTSLNVIITPALAKKLGVSYHPLGVIVNYKQPITVDQKDALYQALPGGFEYDPGPVTDLNGTSWLITFFAGLFILSATLIALTLSYLESRADQAALWAVGASRSFRSKVLAFQGFSLNLVGGLMGSAVGYSLVLVLTSSLHTVFAVPLAQVLTLSVGLPVLSALLLFVFTPKKYKMRNRLSLD